MAGIVEQIMHLGFYDVVASSTVPIEMIGTQCVERHLTLGDRLWRFVRNHSGSDIDQYFACAFETGSALEVAITQATEDKFRFAGCPQRDGGLPNGYDGWVLCGGLGYGISDAAIAIGAAVRLAKAGADAGRIDDTAPGAGTSIFYIGRAMANTVAGAGEAILIEFQK